MRDFGTIVHVVMSMPILDPGASASAGAGAGADKNGIGA